MRVTRIDMSTSQKRAQRIRADGCDDGYVQPREMDVVERVQASKIYGISCQRVVINHSRLRRFKDKKCRNENLEPCRVFGK